MSCFPRQVLERALSGTDLAVQAVNQKGLCLQRGKGLYVLGADRFFGLLP